MLSSFYVSVHNMSLANKQTISIPVCERDYKIIIKQYVKNSSLQFRHQSETHEEFAISGSYIILDHVLCYFYGNEQMDNLVHTIRMFGWLNCTEKLKEFVEQYKIQNNYSLYLTVINEIMTCAIKHKNEELFYCLLNNLTDEEIKIYCDTNIPFEIINIRKYKKYSIRTKEQIAEYFAKVLKLDDTYAISLLVAKKLNIN